MNEHPDDTLLIPARLQRGDTIAVISPAGSLNSERLERLQRGITYLRQQGFSIQEGQFLREQHGYLAGTDDQRAQDLNEMLARPDVKAIFCARGGYGINRILDKIDVAAAQRFPKIFVGYSDITALQLALFAKIGLVTFSGPMVAIEMGEPLPELAHRELWTMLMQAEPQTCSAHLENSSPVTYASGIAEGRLLGGCLSVLVSLLGTPYLPDFSGAILLLEDIGEDLYKIDRYFSQLKHAGVLQRIAGVVLGQFVHIHPDENNNPVEFDDIISYYLAPLNIPVVGQFPYGHVPLKYTLPLGCQVRLDAEAGTLQFLQSGVS